MTSTMLLLFFVSVVEPNGNPPAPPPTVPITTTAVARVCAFFPEACTVLPEDTELWTSTPSPIEGEGLVLVDYRASPVITDATGRPSFGWSARMFCIRPTDSNLPVLKGASITCKVSGACDHGSAERYLILDFVVRGPDGERHSFKGLSASFKCPTAAAPRHQPDAGFPIPCSSCR